MRRPRETAEPGQETTDRRAGAGPLGTSRRLRTPGLQNLGAIAIHAATFPVQAGRRIATGGTNDRAGHPVRTLRLSTRYGHAAHEGFAVNHKRVERLWRREGLKVPKKQPKRRRLWLNDGSCVRRRPAYRDHVWSYDFVMARTRDGRAFRLLTLIDEYTRECLALATWPGS